MGLIVGLALVLGAICAPATAQQGQPRRFFVIAVSLYTTVVVAKSIGCVVLLLA